ncbi:MAG: short-chain dehydrogenase [Chitinophagaceae bacterium]|nr:short-chain dehydrogenase [Chitinophagaceae bacterium]
MKRNIEKIIAKPARPGMAGDGFRLYNYIPGANIPPQKISPLLLYIGLSKKYAFERLTR